MFESENENVQCIVCFSQKDFYIVFLQNAIKNQNGNKKGELLSSAVSPNAKTLSVFHLLYQKVPLFPRGDSPFLALLI